MKALDRKLVLDVAAWAGNVSTSVLIIFINKVLMSKAGYGFKYATTLCALHYLTCSAGCWGLQRTGYIKRTSMPIQDLLLFTVTADLSIVTLNLSLMLNPVSFYQIAKLCIIPCSCFVEAYWLKRRYTQPVIASVIIVLVGVAIVTVTDLSVKSNVMGLVVAGLSVVSSTMQQIFCRTMQQKYKLASHELLATTAPAQGWSLIIVGPFLDAFVSGSWVAGYHFTTRAALMLAFSCFMAVGVNVSQFTCLGRFPAVSFQVLGHTKTIMVLLGGWIFLGDTISMQQLMGMAVAVSGMVLYGITTSRAAAPASKKSVSLSLDEINSLLDKSGEQATLEDGRITLTAAGARKSPAVKLANYV